MGLWTAWLLLVEGFRICRANVLLFHITWYYVFLSCTISELDFQSCVSGLRHVASFQYKLLQVWLPGRPAGMARRGDPLGGSDGMVSIPSFFIQNHTHALENPYPMVYEGLSRGPSFSDSATYIMFFYRQMGNNVESEKTKSEKIEIAK